MNDGDRPNEDQVTKTKKPSTIKIILTSLLYGVIGVPLLCHIVVHVQHGSGMDGKDAGTAFIAGLGLSVLLIVCGGLSALLRHDVHPVVQFIKYVIVDGLAIGVHITAFFLCGWFSWHAAFCNAIAFTLSNTVCYLLDRLFVFKPGRYHWTLEFLFFFGASGLSLAIGTAIQTFLISHHGMQTTYAFGANLVTALLINYAMRKFVIFKG